MGEIEKEICDNLAVIVARFDLGHLNLTGLDPIRGKTAPSNGAVSTLLLPKATGSASRNFRARLCV